MIKKLTVSSVFAKWNTDRAIKKMKKKKVTPGIDGMRYSELPDFWEENRQSILDSIKNGTFNPTPTRIYYFSKPGKTEKRKIAVSTALDQMLQDCIRFKINVYYAGIFHRNSYGFMRGKSTEMAALRALEYINNGKVWIVDADIRKCFDNIKHYMIINEIGKAVEDEMLLKLISKYLKNPGIIGRSLLHNRVGVSQGSCLSPVLANVVLNNLDWYLDSLNISFVRYADDLAIFCETEKEALMAREVVDIFIKKRLSLELNREKTGIVTADKFDYLGFAYGKGDSGYYLKPTAKGMDNMMHMIAYRFNQINAEDINLTDAFDLIGAVNRGWIGYYRNARSGDMDDFISRADNYEDKKIKDLFNSFSFRNIEDVVESILKSKGYVTPQIWYDEINERSEAYEKRSRKME